MVRFRRPNRPWVDPLTVEGRQLVNQARLDLLKAWDTCPTSLEYYEAEFKFRKVLEHAKACHRIVKDLHS